MAPAVRSRVVVTAAPPVPAPPASTPKPGGPLREELDLLDGARGALATSDATTALRLVDEHATRFPSGAFAVERDVIRIDALEAAGRHAEAVAHARSFVARHPASAQAGRIAKIAEANP